MHTFPSWVMWIQNLANIDQIVWRHKIFKVKVTTSRSKVTGHKNMPVHTYPSSWKMCTYKLETVAAIAWVQHMGHDFHGQGHSFKVEGHWAKMCQCTPTLHGECANTIWRLYVTWVQQVECDFADGQMDSHTLGTHSTCRP